MKATYGASPIFDPMYLRVSLAYHHRVCQHRRLARHYRLCQARSLQTVLDHYRHLYHHWFQVRRRQFSIQSSDSLMNGIKSSDSFCLEAQEEAAAKAVRR